MKFTKGYWMNLPGVETADVCQIREARLDRSPDGDSLYLYAVCYNHDARAMGGPVLELAVSSPLPGSITQIMVTPGQSVKQGDILLIMESMKMANNITSEFEGTVKTIFVQQGASVMQGDNLVEIA